MFSHAQYKIIALPKYFTEQNQWDKLVGLYKEFRLLSLQDSPRFFSSSYAKEIAFQKEVWEERLRNPLAVTFVAISAPPGLDGTLDSSDLEQLLSRDWLGNILLLGPIDDTGEKVSGAKSPWESLNSQKSETGGATTNLHYHINATFVVPSARGIKLGKALLEAALSLGDNTGIATGKNVRFSLVVDDDNPYARKVYRDAGFEDVQKEMFWQEPRGPEAETTKAKGDISLVQRTAVTMERWSHPNYSSMNPDKAHT
ncbi:hypothetical protein M501DRAFT_998365 [Patellaria atrata CBS 101060]|uniref:N-acetyltransferase domain-containing protein n=1 Tax=Patellaria atrata CBS 101060 TaxID=1346257 RepID=A0A9P4SHX8_9PEZI|nr:hypothetical protein M501DRAFT_998365 [Patellaria atrata CBS 101060]